MIRTLCLTTILFLSACSMQEAPSIGCTFRHENINPAKTYATLTLRLTADDLARNNGIRQEWRGFEIILLPGGEEIIIGITLPNGGGTFNQNINYANQPKENMDDQTMTGHLIIPVNNQRDVITYSCAWVR